MLLDGMFDGLGAAIVDFFFSIVASILGIVALILGIVNIVLRMSPYSWIAGVIGIALIALIAITATAIGYGSSNSFGVFVIPVVILLVIAGILCGIGIVISSGVIGAICANVPIIMQHLIQKR